MYKCVCNFEARFSQTLRAANLYLAASGQIPGYELYSSGRRQFFAVPRVFLFCFIPLFQKLLQMNCRGLDTNWASGVSVIKNPCSVELLNTLPFKAEFSST